MAQRAASVDFAENDEPALGRSNTESLVASMVESEDVTPTVKSVLDRGIQRDFLQELDAFAIKKATEIESLCNFGYQDFISSVDDLLTVRTNVESLRKQVATLDDTVQGAGGDLLHTAEALVDVRRKLVHVRRMRRKIEISQVAVRLFAEARNDIQRGRLHAALHTLSSLQHDAINHIKDTKFADEITRTVPALLSYAKETVMTEFTRWLEQVRSHARQVGKVVMQQRLVRSMVEDELKEKQKIKHTKATEEMLLRSLATSKQDGSAALETSIRRRASVFAPDPDYLQAAKLVLSPGRRASLLVDAEDVESEMSDERSVFEQIGLDFTPLHHCHYIFETLSAEQEFAEFYKDNRRLQLNIDLNPPPGADVLEVYQEYFERIVGFFIVEDSVFKTAGSLLSSSDLDTAWEAAYTRIMQVLSDALMAMRDSAMMLQLKEHLELMCAVLQEYGFYVGPLLDFVDRLRSRYHEVLEQKYREACMRVVYDDALELVQTSTKEQVLALFHVKNENIWFVPTYHGLSVDEYDKPQTHSMSVTVPQIVRNLINMTFDLFAFTRLSLEMYDVVRAMVDRILCESVDKAIESRISSSSSDASASTAILIAANCIALSNAALDIDTYAAKLCSAKTHGSGDMQAVGALTATATRANDIAFQLAVYKLNMILAQAPPQALPSTPSSHPSPVYETLASELHKIVSSLHMLTEDARDDIESHLFRIIAEHMWKSFRGTHVKAFNMFTVFNVDRDLRLVEGAVSACRVEESALRHLRGLRQFIDLVMNPKPEHVLDRKSFSAECSALDPVSLAAVLEKYKDVNQAQALLHRKGRAIAKKKTIVALAAELRAMDAE